MNLYRVEYFCDYWNDEAHDFVPTKRKRYAMGYALGRICYDLAHKEDVDIADIYKIKISRDTLRKCWNNVNELV